MTWEYKKGDIVLLIFHAKIIMPWGMSDNPLYQVELTPTVSTSPKEKKIKIDIRQSDVQACLIRAEKEGKK